MIPIPPRVYVYGAAVLIVAAALGVQQVRIANLRASLATEQRGRADDKLAAERAATQQRIANAAAEREHAAAQQEIVHGYETRLAAAAAAAARRDADLRRVRDQLAGAGRRAAGESDAAAAGRLGDQAQRLGGLAIEGAELVAEAARILGERDATVNLLLDTINNDSAICR